MMPKAKATAELKRAAKAATASASARMDEAMQRQERELITSPSLKAGDLVYRVIEYDPPEEGVSHTWKIESRAVKQASDKQITLQSFFPGGFRIQFPPNAIERRFFFPTPALAIESFAADQRSGIENLDHKRKEAERALAWAYEQGAERLATASPASISSQLMKVQDRLTHAQKLMSDFAELLIEGIAEESAGAKRP